MSDLNDLLFDDLDEVTDANKKGRQGFASMSEDKQKTIASKGGKAAHAQGTAHEWSSDEAREAGRKGGLARKTSEGDVYEEEEIV